MTDRTDHRPRPDEPARRRPRRQCRGDARRGAPRPMAPIWCVVPELQLTGYPPEDLVLKPRVRAPAMEEAERLVDATADGGPAMLFGIDRTQRRGTIYNACCSPTAASSSAAPAQARAAQLRHVRREARVRRRPACPSRSNGAGSGSACRSARTSGWKRSAPTSPRPGAELLIVPNGSPYELDKDDLRQRMVRQPRGRDRPAAGLPQPRRRAGRTGVRRVELRHQRRRRDGGADARLGGGAVADRVEADRRRLALRHPSASTLDPVSPRTSTGR